MATGTGRRDPHFPRHEPRRFTRTPPRAGRRVLAHISSELNASGRDGPRPGSAGGGRAAAGGAHRSINAPQRAAGPAASCGPLRRHGTGETIGQRWTRRTSREHHGGEPGLTCPHCRDVPGVFDGRVARRQLRRYRRRGPPKTTRMLLEALPPEGVEGRTVLDVGGGVGVVQHELLARGARLVINAEASPAYQDAARREAERRGALDRMEFYLGDFVEAAPAIPSADIVILDRVICCYPDMEALVDTSAAHARIAWGAVFPREHLPMRLALAVANLLLRLRRSAFRVYAHSTAGVEEVLRAQGFTPRVHRRTLLWQVTVWVRA